VLLLLFRPVLSFQRELRERRAVVFLLDRSASMGIMDDAKAGSRLEHAADRALAWLRKLSGEFETHVVAFAEAPEPVAEVEQLSQIEATGPSTSLSRALGAAAKVKAARDVAAVFLFSDGIHNSAGDPLAVAERLGLPIHTIGVGSAARDRTTYRDIQVTGATAPEQMALGNLARVTGYVDAIGYPGRVAQVVLEEDGAQVSTKDLVLDDVEGTQEIILEFTPKTKGLHTYTVHLPPATEEKIPQNNRRATSSLVVDARIRVLYLEGTLRAEYGALAGRFLSKDPDIEFCSLVQTRPNVFLHRSNIAELELTAIPKTADEFERFDVFVIGDLDSTYLKAEQMQWLADRVQRGAGLLMIGGYHGLGPGGYQGTPLAEVLPAFLGDREIGQITVPFSLQLTPEGRSHAIFANIAQFFAGAGRASEIEGLPLLEGCVRLQAAKPSASVLAVHPSEMAGTVPMPVLAVQPLGKGRSAVFTADTTRNWHQTLRTLDRETPFVRFWGQMVRWLAGRSEQVDAAAGITATTNKACYDPESPVTISAVVRGREGEAMTDARVSAQITGPGGADSKLDLPPIPGPAGNYRADFEPQKPGRYEIAVMATSGNVTLKAEVLQVEVGRPNLEFERLELDEKTLVAIANQSGGSYSHLASADRLIERLNRREENRRVAYEMSLAWPPFMWIAFVLALTAEWVLRRRHLLR
jgi:uncharacterized membrane protein